MKNLLVLPILFLTIACGADKTTVMQASANEPVKQYLYKELICRTSDYPTTICYSNIDIDEDIVKVMVIQKLSRTDCILDKTFTHNDRLITVKGCSAKFLVLYTRS